jgi:hypothetical protein
MSAVSLDGLKTSIISNSLLQDVGEDAFLPYVGSINTITQNTSNDGNVVSVQSNTTFATGNPLTFEVPKYGYWGCCVIEFPHTAIGDLVGSSNTIPHCQYNILDSCEVRSQGKKLLSWTGQSMACMLEHYLSKSQFDAVMNLAGSNGRTRSFLIVPLPSFFDKKLALNTVMLDRMEIVLKFKTSVATLANHTLPSGAGTLHFWYHQVDPETESMIRSELFKSGNRNLLMFDCPSYSASAQNATSVNLTSQKLVRCHYVDEYVGGDSKQDSHVTVGVSSTNKILVKAGGRSIYESPKAVAILNSVYNGREVNQPRTLCIDYRNGVIKGSSADYSSGLALRHLPNPTLEISAYNTGQDRLLVHEEAYVLVAIDANSGRISVTAEN